MPGPDAGRGSRTRAVATRDTTPDAGPDDTCRPVRPADDCQQMASGLNALETRSGAATSESRNTLARFTPPVVAVGLVLVLWQLAHTLGWSEKLPAPAAVAAELTGAWSDGTLLPAVGHSLLRCLIGFGAATAIGVPLGLALTRTPLLRVLLGPVLSAVQSLPAAALVPVAVLALGNSEGAVYAVVLLGAVPSIAVTVAAAIDQLPPLLLRAGRSMGATGPRGAALVLLPAAMPGFISALRQGWTFGWRALMTAELITATPLPGIGEMLAEGNATQSMTLVLASVTLILTVGVLVESALFRPLERRVLRGRGLADGN